MADRVQNTAAQLLGCFLKITKDSPHTRTHDTSHARNRKMMDVNMLFMPRTAKNRSRNHRSRESKIPPDTVTEATLPASGICPHFCLSVAILSFCGSTSGSKGSGMAKIIRSHAPNCGSFHHAVSRADISPFRERKAARRISLRALRKAHFAPHRANQEIAEENAPHDVTHPPSSNG